MTAEYVVVLRLTTGDEVVGLLINDNADYIEIEQPFLIAYNRSLESIVLHPLCPWSDEKIFTIYQDKILYVVDCLEKIAVKYLNMIEERESVDLEDVFDMRGSIDALGESLDPTYKPITDEEEGFINMVYIKGNDTKH